MSTSNRSVYVEAAVAAVMAALAVALISPGDVWLTGLGFHPAWIVVLVLAARYGSLGLFVTLGATVAALVDDMGPLRARHDRIDLSLTVWRDLTARLESGDVEQAARAAVELC